ncbi:MAG TPA: LEA type 2 family protein [Polyangia bacterium]|nr:LEA type 2 family protein [Polyangia bacterium]
MRLPVVAFLVAALLPMAGCDLLFSKPTVTVERVDLTAISFTGISANIVFKIENHNAIGIDLAKLVYQLTVDNHPFVQGAANNPLHVPAAGVGQLTLPVSFKFIELAEALASIFHKREVPYTIATQLGFGTPLGVLTVPIAHAGTLPVPQLPSIAINDAAVGGVNLSGASLSVTIGVHNNNSFALPVGALRYALAVNGAPILSASTAPTQLAAGGTLPLTVSAHVDFVRVGLGILRAIQSRSATIALDGDFDLLGYAMPVHLAHAIR